MGLHISDPKSTQGGMDDLGEKRIRESRRYARESPKELANRQRAIEEVLGTRTRAIQRKLKDVDTSDREARAILPEIGILTEEDEKTES